MRYVILALSFYLASCSGQSNAGLFGRDTGCEGYQPAYLKTQVWAKTALDRQSSDFAKAERLVANAVSQAANSLSVSKREALPEAIYKFCQGNPSASIAQYIAFSRGTRVTRR